MLKTQIYTAHKLISSNNSNKEVEFQFAVEIFFCFVRTLFDSNATYHFCSLSSSIIVFIFTYFQWINMAYYYIVPENQHDRRKNRTDKLEQKLTKARTLNIVFPRHFLLKDKGNCCNEFK